MKYNSNALALHSIEELSEAIFATFQRLPKNPENLIQMEKLADDLEKVSNEIRNKVTPML